MAKVILRNSALVIAGSPRQQQQPWMAMFFVLLLLVFILAGCSRPARGSSEIPVGATVTGSTSVVAEVAVNDTGTPGTDHAKRATITVAPAHGYAGTFVDVSGAGWPPSAMVLVKLADEQGRSSVLSATAADAKGEFTTGFVYPVGDRWLRPGARTVLAHTEDGQVETTAPFTVAPPAGVSAPTATPTAAAPSPTAIPPAPPAPQLSVTATITFTSGGLASAPPTPAPPATPLVVAAAAPAPTATPAPPATPPVAAALQETRVSYGAPLSTIDDLLAAIKRMPASALDPQLANSLTKKLSNAQKQVDKGHAIPPAANMLRAFQNEVTAQSGKHIAPDAAAFLIASADNVIAHLQQGQPARTGVSSGSDNGSGNDDGKGNDKGNGKGKDNDKSNGNGRGKGGKD